MGIKLDSEQEFEQWYYIGDKCDHRKFEGDNLYYSAKAAWIYQQQKITTLENKLKIAEEALGSILTYPKDEVYGTNTWHKVAWETRQLSGQALAKIRGE